MNNYLGHENQLSYFEEHRLVGGKGDGMRLIEVNNGKGLQFTVSADRAADVSRLTFKGVNVGFFAPCGYVSPKYYDHVGAGFLKSFTAGFLTTCGLTAVGTPCTDDGEDLPLHGTISNIPAENVYCKKTEDSIIISADIRDAALFGRKLVLHRTYECSLTDNTITITDTAENLGTEDSPYMMLYHFNIGYPLLSEDAVVDIPANGIVPRNDFAAEDIENCLKMEKPQSNIEERCYFHDVKSTDGIAKVSIENKTAGIGMTMEYSAETLPEFCEWKMMGEIEYVLGLEPANCTPDGRALMRETGKLKFLKAGEKSTNVIKLKFKEI